MKNIWNTIKLNAELTQTNERMAVSDKARIQAETDLKEAQDVIGNFMVEKQNFEKTIKELQDKLDAATKEHAEKVTALTKDYESKLVVEKASVGSKVNKELANVGVQADALKISEDVLPTKAEAIEKLSALKGSAATDYYNKYKSVINSK